MKLSRALFSFLCVAAVAATVNRASAVTYTDDFPSATSTVIGSVGTIAPGEYGYFWSVGRGDSISELFAGTGLASVVELKLDFNITQNVLTSGNAVNWDVLVNGNTVGSWLWNAAMGTGNFTSTYNFGAIAGAGTYTIAMKVTNEVPGGAGSIAIGDGTMRLSDTASGVPDSAATVGLLSVGLMVLAAFRRRQ